MTTNVTQRRHTNAPRQDTLSSIMKTPHPSLWLKQLKNKNQLKTSNRQYQVLARTGKWDHARGSENVALVETVYSSSKLRRSHTGHPFPSSGYPKAVKTAHTCCPQTLTSILHPRPKVQTPATSTNRHMDKCGLSGRWETFTHKKE